MKHTDPVCGMEVDEKEAAGTSRYQEKDYYFCAPDCKEAFDEDPTDFLENAPRQ